MRKNIGLGNLRSEVWILARDSLSNITRIAWIFVITCYQMTRQRYPGVHMKRRKNAIVIVIENRQMAVTSTKFWNFFNFEKVEVQKLENFEKWLLLFLNIFYISLKVFFIFYVGGVGLDRSPSLAMFLYEFYLNQPLLSKGHFSPKKSKRPSKKR